MTLYAWRTKPYRHQVAAVRFALAKFKAGENPAFLCAPRTGKTKMTIDTLSILSLKNGLRKVMIVCPNRVIGTWIEEFATHCPLVYQVVVWDKDARKTPLPSPSGHYDLQVILVNYEAFSTPGRRLPSGKRSAASGRMKHRAILRKWIGKDPAACVLDECHPAGTQVSTPDGDKPIEQLQVGDTVWSHDGSVVKATVTHTFNRETEEGLWSVGETRMTPHHPVWTTEGYVPAHELRTYHQVMQLLSSGVSGEQTPKTVLRSLVCPAGYVCETSGVEDSSCGTHEAGSINTRSTSQVECPSTRANESLSRSGSTETISRGESTEHQFLSTNRGQWNSPFPSRANAIERFTIRLVSRIRGAYWKITRQVQGPQSLQDRHSPSGISNRHRDSGKHSQVSQGQRSRLSKKGLPDRDWVVGIPILKPAGTNSTGCSREVYNIETSVGNYFADDLLVHNSHKIKSASSKASLMLRSMRDDFRYRMILTGTVQTKAKRAHDIFAQWQFLNPDRFPEWPTVTDFKNATGRWIDSNGYPQWLAERPAGMARLKARVHMDSFVVTREECFDLPPVDNQIIRIPLTDSARVYDEMAEEMVARLENGEIAEASIPLVVTLRLSQITSGFVGIREPDPSGRKMVSRPVRVGFEKLNALETILTEEVLERDEKVLIAAKFNFDMDSIGELCARHGIPYYEIRGKVKPSDADEARRTFNRKDGPAVFILQPQAASLGIDLRTAYRMIWFSLTSSWVDYVQCGDRNALSPVPRIMTYLLAEGTVDEALYDVLQLDGEVARDIMRKPRKLLRGVT